MTYSAVWWGSSSHDIFEIFVAFSQYWQGNPAYKFILKGKGREDILVWRSVRSASAQEKETEGWQTLLIPG